MYINKLVRLYNATYQPNIDGSFINNKAKNFKKVNIHTFHKDNIISIIRRLELPVKEFVKSSR